MPTRTVFASWQRVLLLCGVVFGLAACGGGGGDAVPVPPAAVAPSISQQPVSQSVVAGGSTTFSVAASGTAPLGFQWLRNGVEVAGATQASQTVAAATVVQDSGSRWSVRVSNAAGSVTSAEALLTVTVAPVPLGLSLTTGSPSGTGTLDGKGRAAYFNTPGGIAFDPAGNAYVADTLNRTIRKVTADGTVTTLAGATGGTGLEGARDGTGAQAVFIAPRDLVMGPDGALYAVDFGKLRRVTTDGVVTTVAAPARTASLSTGPDGALYLATPTAVYRLVPGAEATLVAGQEGASGWTDGVGAAATFYGIADIAADAARTVYVSQPDTHTLRRIAADGTVTTFAGLQSAMGSVDGIGAAARFSRPGTLALDAGGNLWVAELGSGRLRKVTPSGSVTTPYGADRAFFSNQGSPSVPLAFGPDGQLDFSVGSGVSRIDAAGVVTTLAGQDYPGEAGIGAVAGLAADPQGNVIVANTVQGGADVQFAVRVELGKFTTGGERLPFHASVPLPSPAFTAFPGVGADTQGNIHVSSATSRSGGINVFLPTGGSIARVAPDGTVSTLVSWPADSAGALAPAFLRIGRDGAFYFVDLIANNLVKWTPAAGASVLANLGQPSLLFSLVPWNIAADAAGKVYVARYGLVQRVDNGALVTVAGAAAETGTADGPGTQARFVSISAAVADAAGNLYLADREVVRKLAPDGTVSTVAGTRGSVGLRTGALPANLGMLGSMAIGPDGLLHLVSGDALVKIRLQ